MKIESSLPYEVRGEELIDYLNDAARRSGLRLVVRDRFNHTYDLETGDLNKRYVNSWVDLKWGPFPVLDLGVTTKGKPDNSLSVKTEFGSERTARKFLRNLTDVMDSPDSEEATATA